MDPSSSTYRSTSQSKGDKKRSSPPPLRARPISPSPPPIVNGNSQSGSLNGVGSSTGSASASAYTSRSSATSRAGMSHSFANGVSSLNPYAPDGPFSYGAEAVDEPGMLDLTEPTSASGNMGEYAYSTTLRRQQSMEHGFPPFSPVHHHHGHRRTSSPHHSSPFRKRTGSNPYTADSSGSPYGRYEAVDEERDPGFMGRIWANGRRMLGKKDYEQLKEEEEDLQREKERRQRETPSSIYAHKTVDVSPPPGSVASSAVTDFPDNRKQ